MRWLPTATAALALVIGVGLLALLWLNDWASRNSSGMSRADAASLRLDAIKTALTVAAGVAAGVTLLLTLRRQSMSERGQRFAEEDAQEQRVTELYVAAVEQLGSDKAAVRLGGLVALERLGQDNPKLRQTVMDVICAYLRMPYTPPADVLLEDDEHSPEHLAKDSPTPDPEQQAERQQELQVRLTAQRLIADHTYAPDDGETTTYWRSPGEPGDRMALDLAGAVLVNLNLEDCQPGPVNLKRAQFHGWTFLGRAHIHGIADLQKAQFHAGADLGEVQFHDRALMFGVQFHGPTNLSLQVFHRDADLREAQFHRQDTYLRGAQFHGRVDLRRARFHGSASLQKVRFDKDVDLDGAQFDTNADLVEAQFRGRADLQGRTDQGGRPFRGVVELREARVSTRVRLPAGWTVTPIEGEELLRVEVADMAREVGRVSTKAPARPN